jgi:hypothetical protein
MITLTALPIIFMLTTSIIILSSLVTGRLCAWSKNPLRLRDAPVPFLLYLVALSLLFLLSVKSFDRIYYLSNMVSV